MAQDTQAATDLAQRIDTIEESYELMLAYAAQGVPGDDPSSGHGVRESLERMAAALDGLAAASAERVKSESPDAADSYGDFIDVIDQDARKALAAVRLVLGRPAIGSQLIDNLNGSIHLRALLTDLFIIDESLKEGGASDSD